MEIKDGGILIIATPRTGSTNLMRSIGSVYGKKTHMDLPIHRTERKYNPATSVVKYMLPINELLDFKTLDIDNVNYGFVFKKIKEFNTIILLNRINHEEQIESYYVLKKYHNNKCDIKWRDEVINKDDIFYKEYKSYFELSDIVFKKLSEDLNIPIDYYEDVYKNKSLTNKNIKLDLEYFKPKYKLRQKIKIKRLV